MNMSILLILKNKEIVKSTRKTNNPTEHQAKDTDKSKTIMSYKHVKRCSTSLATSEIQIKNNYQSHHFGQNLKTKNWRVT